MFNAAALAIGTFGAIPLAAHAIALQIAATIFMVPLGIGQAATVRVGLALGAGDRGGVTQAGRAAIALAVAVTATSALALALLPDRLVGLFLDRGNPANAETVRLATTFLIAAAVFQLADGLQAVAGGLLRGLQDARVPMLIAGFGYWGIGAALGLTLAGPAALGPIGIWIGLSSGLAVVAGLMLLRWARRAPLLDRRLSGPG